MAGLAEDHHRLRQVQLANMRQEMLAPVGGIVGYGEMLREAAERSGLDELIPDLDRILASARDLFAMVDRLLDMKPAGELVAGEDAATVQQRLRHDLRTPINAIQGYAEMLVEDLGDGGGETLRSDFERLLAETNRLLASLDTIIDFSRTGNGGGEIAGEAAGMAAMFSDVVRSIRPVAGNVGRVAEPGSILVVDDIDTNRDLLSRRLSQSGHRVTEAAGGIEALELLRSRDFDLVLLDLMMPDLNGFEVLARLKKDDRLREIPVIMISALDETDSVIRCIEAGAEDYLPKPFDPVLLAARINTCLERKQGRDRERMYLDRLKSEHEKFEKLLLNVLPRQIVGRLNDGETLIADRFDEVTVLFSDLVGFTEMSARLAPSRVVDLLNRLFSDFDAVGRGLGVEKIKMMGDAYMAVAGAPEPRPGHARAIAEMAVGMIDGVARLNLASDETLRIRIGIHTGPVVAGIIGTHRFLYDVWGDTVNLAARLETSCPPDRIHVSEASVRLLRDDFAFESRGIVELKGKGSLETFLLAPPTGPEDGSPGA